MNILLTGGAGFIGSHLCEYSMKKGDKVVCVDNFFTGSNIADTLPVQCNTGEFTRLQLVEKVMAITGSKSKISYKPIPPDDPQKRRPDISLAKEKLGWEPKVQLEEGLKKTIEYFRTVI